VWALLDAISAALDTGTLQWQVIGVDRGRIVARAPALICPG
jgi:hypothetical protein